MLLEKDCDLVRLDPNVRLDRAKLKVGHIERTEFTEQAESNNLLN